MASSSAIPMSLQWCTPCLTACRTFIDGQRVVYPNPLPSPLPDGELARSVHKKQEPHSRTVTAVEVFASDTRALTASADHTLKIWDLTTGRVRHTLHGHGQSVTCCVVLDGSTQAVSGSADCSVKVWDLQKLVCSDTFTGHAAKVIAVAAVEVPRNSAFLDEIEMKEDNATSRGSSTRYDGAQQEERQGSGNDAGDGTSTNVRRVGEQGLAYGAVTKDEVKEAAVVAVSSASSPKQQTWSLVDMQESGQVLADDDPNKRQAAVMPSASWLSDSTTAVATALWPPAAPPENPLEKGVGGARDVVAASRERSPLPPVWRKATTTLLLSASEDATIKVWDLERRCCVRTLRGHEGAVKCVATFGLHRGGGGGFNTGVRVLSGGSDKMVRVWDLGTGQCVHSMKGHTGGITSCAVFAHGSGGRRAELCLTGSEDESLRVWDLDHGECVKVLKGHDECVTCCAVYGGRGGTAGVDDDEEEEEQEEEEENLEDMGDASRQRRKERRRQRHTKLALSGSYDETLRVWKLRLPGYDDEDPGDPHEGEFEEDPCLIRLEGHEGGITSCAVFRNGEMAASGSFDKSMKTWDIPAMPPLVAEAPIDQPSTATSKIAGPLGFAVV